jgi:3-oxoacyl-[acyl-carrier-protein] synthase II
MRVPPSFASTHPPPPPLLGRDVPPFAHYALIAAAASLQDAGLPPRLSDTAGLRAGTAIGVGMAHVADLVHAGAQLAAGRPRRVSPFLVPRVLLNTPAGLVAQTHNLRGPNTAPATACAAGAHAVADGLHAIRRGDADVMVVGGTEAAIEAVGMAGFGRARALSTGFADDPAAASRPFDAARDGFVMGEGAGVLVLEAADAAAARGVTSAYAELAGAGASGDAFHPTSPPPDGDGAQRAMAAALDSARLLPSDIDYVNAHATSTPTGDTIERRAIAQFLSADVCGSRAVVSSTKGLTGHLLGAAGAVEAALAAMAVATGTVPPTANLNSLEEDAHCEGLGWGDLARYVPLYAVRRQVDVALSNSFGFGGTNACVVFARPPDGFERRRLED